MTALTASDAALTAPPPVAARRLHGLRQRALPWALPVLIVAAWELASRAGWLSPRILPEPWAVITAFWNLLRSGELGQHVAVSTGRALAGLAIGGGLGLVLGLLTGSFLVCGFQPWQQLHLSAG